MSLGKVVMPKIGEIKWRRDGYGYQVLDFSVGGEMLTDHRGYCLGEVKPSYPLKRGYVKIWYRDDYTVPRVVDRALTVASARKMMSSRKKRGADKWI